MSSASLHVTMTDATPTCDGNPTTVPMPLTVDVTWTAIGPLTSDRKSSQTVCGGFRTESSEVWVSTNTSAAVTLSGAVDESFASTQDANTSTGHMSSDDLLSHVEGGPAC
jgi:hypothetical protein